MILGMGIRKQRPTSGFMWSLMEVVSLCCLARALGDATRKYASVYLISTFLVVQNCGIHLFFH